MAAPLHTDPGIAFKFLSLIFWIEKTRDLWVLDFGKFCGNYSSIALYLWLQGRA